MADLYKRLKEVFAAGSLANVTPKSVLHDNGDGTFSEVGYVGGGQVSVNGLAQSLAPNGIQADQALTVDATAGGVQFGALHADTTHVFWSCETAQCRVTFDASTPTTSNGHIIEPGDSGVWSKALAAAAKFIRTGATSAVIAASQLKG